MSMIDDCVIINELLGNQSLDVLYKLYKKFFIKIKVKFFKTYLLWKQWYWSDIRLQLKLQNGKKLVR